MYQEYSDTQVLQMIGRAGRPQFDTSATAVIMTKNQTKVGMIELGTVVVSFLGDNKRSADLKRGRLLV